MREPLESFAAKRGYCKSTNPLGTNKEVDHGYLSNVYQLIFNFVNVKSILEIGLMWGYSLRLWQDFLQPNLCIGIENGESVSQRNFEKGTGPTVINKDAFKYQTYNALTNEFDLIIDDANHTLYQQSRAATIFSRKLADKGILVIEDIEPSERHLKNILNSIPPLKTVKIFVVDLTSQENRLPNSICVVIQNLSQDGSRGLEVTNNYWKEMKRSGLGQRIALYIYQRTFVCPFERIKTSLTYRLKKFLRN